MEDLALQNAIVDSGVYGGGDDDDHNGGDGDVARTYNVERRETCVAHHGPTEGRADAQLDARAAERRR